MRLRLLLLAVPALLLAACGKEPYTDADLTEALSGVDHVVSAQAGCSDAGLSWRCMPQVDLAPEADADAVAAAISKTASLTEADRDEVTVTIGAGDDGDPEPRGVTVTFTTLPPEVGALAAGVVSVLASKDLGHTSFEADDKGVSIVADFAPGSTMQTIASVSRSLVDTAGASSVLAVEPSARLRLSGGAAAAAWPDAELAVFEAVRKEHLIESTVIRKDFISILLSPGEDVDAARALAAAQSGSGSIETIFVTDDPDADISGTGEDVDQAPALADALRQQPGYVGVSVGNNTLNVQADSLAHAEAMDALLHQSFSAAYDGLDATYEIEGVAKISRPAGTTAWFDAARTLVDSGLFASVQVGDLAPEDGGGAIKVIAADGVPPTDAVAVIARAWQPDRDTEVKLSWDAERSPFTLFDAGDTISIRPSARVSKEVAASIERAWAAAR